MKVMTRAKAEKIKAANVYECNIDVGDGCGEETGVEVTRAESHKKQRRRQQQQQQQQQQPKEAPISSRTADDDEENSGTTATSADRAANGNKRSVRTTLYRSLWCCVCLAVAAGVVVLIIHLIDESDDVPKTEPATCGDCHCILDNDVSSCPERPPTNYSQEFLDALRAQTPINPYPLLECDPYLGGTCEFVPPNTELGEDAVCGIHYDDTVNCSTYQLQSYITRDAAEAAGAFVTHVGECGACSTTQDLAVYLEFVDLTTFGTRCGTKAVASYDQGRACFEELGLTPACADIWTDNTRHTARQCGLTCALHDLKDTPSNGPPPVCTLNDCLTCDEEKSGPIFKQYAGRTRRRSGLLSAIARKCSSIAPIRQDVCPETIPLPR